MELRYLFYEVRLIFINYKNCVDSTTLQLRQNKADHTSSFNGRLPTAASNKYSMAPPPNCNTAFCHLEYARTHLIREAGTFHPQKYLPVIKLPDDNHDNARIKAKRYFSAYGKGTDPERG